MRALVADCPTSPPCTVPTSRWLDPIRRICPSRAFPSIRSDAGATDAELRSCAPSSQTALRHHLARYRHHAGWIRSVVFAHHALFHRSERRRNVDLRLSQSEEHTSEL